uniref:Uncharacterized protein n=1 Tax=Amphimedon queenslandica TaxID=400682 RepID=A0A1X7SME5_AMPQE
MSALMIYVLIKVLVSINWDPMTVPVLTDLCKDLSTFALISMNVLILTFTTVLGMRCARIQLAASCVSVKMDLHVVVMD